MTSAKQTSAGLDQAEQFSSHSLRRGFAGWVRVSGWDLKDLVEYVGWKDVGSAAQIGQSDVLMNVRPGCPPELTGGLAISSLSESLRMNTGYKLLKHHS